MIKYIFYCFCFSSLIFIFHLSIVRITNKVKFIYLIFCLLASILFSFSILFLFSLISFFDFEKIIVMFSINLFIFFAYIEFFSMICRGFSLRILTDVYLNKTVEINSINKIYAMGKGHSWLLKKRIDSIIKSKLIYYDGENYLLTNFGKNISTISIIFKKILKLGKGGE